MYQTLRTQKKSTGFSLIETLLAVTVLVISFGGPLSIAAQSVFTATTARDQIIATYLALEAAEYVRNVRDTNLLEGDAWLAGLESCLADICHIDVAASSLVAQVQSGGGGHMFFDQNTGIYGYTQRASSQTTRYEREVRLTELVANQEVEVQVTVRWQRRSVAREFILGDHLTNWQQ